MTTGAQHTEFEGILTGTEGPLHPLRALCPLFDRDERGWPRAIGSGVLLAIGPARFLVTCAHVADLVPQRDGIFLVESFVDRTLAPVHGQGFISALPHSGTRDDDRIDIAGFKLDPESADGLARQLRFWPIEQVAVGIEAIRDTHYTFSGYPHKDAKPRGKGLVRADPLPITAGAYRDEDFARVGASSTTHLGIKLEGGPLVNHEGTLHSKNPNLPNLLNGLSGGAIWKDFFRWQEGKAVTPKLIGLCMELPKQCPNSFLGVRITAVLEVIRAKFPDLAPFIPIDPDVGVISRRIPRRAEP